MPFRIEGGGNVVADFDAARGKIERDVEIAMEGAAKVALQVIQTAWYGSSASPPREHADGTPSQSTGLSQAGWHIIETDFSGGRAVIKIGNSIDYSQYVHPSTVGDTEGFGEDGSFGFSMGQAEEQFDEAMNTLEDTLVRIAEEKVAEI